MPDISVDFCGIKSPNPFWLASAPPTNSAYQVARAFDAGWGGAVWKTIGEPIVNVSSRYSSIDYNSQKMIGLNNIELISDRTVEENCKELADIKRRYPRNTLIGSLMVESKRESWHEVVKQVEDTGVDGLELNFGCPHGMSERGMGSAVGQVPEYAERITGWVKEVAKTPVIVKLTPNITDVRYVGRAAKKGGADALSLINTINSITGVDLNTFVPRPIVGNKSSHGGYCGPAVKPIALNMVQSIAGDPDIQIPISGIGGIQSWQDAVEFMLLGSTSVQVCTAVMHYGFRIVEHLIEGLENWMAEKGFEHCTDFIGKTVTTVTDWGNLDLNYKINAHIDQDKCVHCGLCYIACEDGAHQAIDIFPRAAGYNHSTINGNGNVHGNGDAPESGAHNRYVINKEHCVGCNLCSLVCPVDNCITMVHVNLGAEEMNWKEFVSTGKKARGEMPAGYVKHTA